MTTKIKLNGACRRALSMGIVVALMLLAVGAMEAATLWSNGAVNTTPTADNRCDSGPNTCGNSGGATWTVFDNFNVPASSKPWVVTGFDFSDFLINGTNADYRSTGWSIWAGDPLSGGTLKASGTATASLATVLGTCGNGSTCLEMLTVTGLNVVLAAGTTYYLGTTNTLTLTNSNEVTNRAFAAGGNTAPGGSANALQRWEQSNGSISGMGWSAGSSNNVFPGALGITETATAFDINGTLAPEPTTFVSMTLALAGLGFIIRRRTT